jgi:hypothetical protein
MGFLTLTLIVQLLWTLSHTASAHVYTEEDLASRITYTATHERTTEFFALGSEEISILGQELTNLKSKTNGLGTIGRKFRFYEQCQKDSTAGGADAIHIRYSRLLLYPFHCFT